MGVESHVVELPEKALALAVARPGRPTRRHNPSGNVVVATHRLLGIAGTTESRLEIFKVSATSKPVAVAGAIAGVVRTQHQVEVQAIGAGAINQAVKAIAISRGYVAPGGLDLVCIPSFINISIDGEERTGIRLVVEVR
jgi:stage V sporulation protein S